MAISGLVFSLFSCSKDSLVQKPLQEDIRGISSLDKVVLYHTETSTKLAFSADTDWKIENCPAWLTITGINNLQGKLGTTVLTFSAHPNLTKATRSADLKFVEVGGTGATLSTLNVSQPAVVFELDVKDKTLNYNWHDHKISDTNLQGAQTIKVNSNIFWQFEQANLEGESTQLFFFSSPEGQDVSDINVVPANPQFERDTTVVATLIPLQKVNGSLKPIEGLAPIQYKMAQGHLLFLASWDAATVTNGEGNALYSELGPKAASYESVTSAQTDAVVNVESVEPWVVTECPDWMELRIDDTPLSVLNTANPVPAGKVQLHVKVLGANPLLNASRSGSFKISPHHKDSKDASGKYVVFRPIDLEQAPFLFEVTSPGDGYSFKNDAPGDATQSGESDDESYTITVKTSGVYENCEIVNVPTDWLSQSAPQLKESGANYNIYDVTFSLKAQNLAFSDISTGAMPVYVQQKASLSQSGDVNMDLRSQAITFSQDKFAFDVSMQATQNLNGVDYTIADLPPALTGWKLMDRPAKDLFKVQATNITGAWELGPETSSWIGVYLSEQMNAWADDNTVTGGKKGQGITIFFAPHDANQNSLNTARTGKLQIVSSQHLARYGSYAQVPAAAKREYKVEQRQFKFTLSPQGKSDQAACNDVPAYSADFANESVKLNLVCDGRWEIRESELPSFLVPDTQLSGSGEEGNYTLEFHLVPNPLPSAKQGSIAVHCLDRNDQIKSSSIKQEAFVYDLTSQSIDNIPAYVQNGSSNDYAVLFHLTEGAKFDVVDQTSGAWAGKTSQSSTSGAGKNNYTRLYFHPNPNLSLSDARSGKVQVTVTEPAGVPNPTFEITFNQNRFYFDLQQTETIQFTELNNRTKSFQIRSSGPWTVTPDQNWMSVSPSSGNGSEGFVTVTLTASENTNQTAREGQVGLTATLLANTLSASVQQKAFQWEVTDLNGGAFDYTFEPLEQRVISFNVKCSSPWSITGIPSWVSVSPQSGNGNEDGSLQTVSITSTKNLSTSAASRVLTNIRIASNKAVYNSDLARDVAVQQKPFIWKIEEGTGGPNLNNFNWDSPLATDTKSLVVTSSGAWRIVSSAGTLTTSGTLGHWNWSWATQSMGAVGDELSIAPAGPNDSFSDTSTQYYIESVEHGTSLRHALACKHDKYVLEVPDNEYKLSFVPWDIDDDPWNTNVASAPQSKSVDVTCSGSWTAETTQDWITPAKDGSQLRVTVTNHNNDISRDGTVTIKSTDPGITRSRTVNVGQGAFVLDLVNSSDKNVYLSTLGESRTVSVNASAKFDYESGTKPDFIVVNNVDNSTGNKGIQFTADVNSTSTSKTGKLTLASHGRTKVIDVSQYPYLFSVQGITSGDTHTYSPVATDGSLSLKVSTNVPWWLSTPEWISVTGATSATPTNGPTATDYNVVLKPSSNYVNTEARSSAFLISNSIVSDAFYVMIQQEGFQTGSASLSTYSPYSASDQTQATSFSTSIPWEASSSVDWITLDKTSGVGGETVSLTLTALNNPTAAQREGTVTISPTAYPGAKRTITVKQSGFVFKTTTASQTSQVLPTAGEADRSIDISCSSPFWIDEQPGFLSLCNIDGSKLHIGVSATTQSNPDLLKGDIVLKSYSDLELKINVKQYPYLFSVEGLSDGQNLELSPEGSKSDVTFKVRSNVAWALAKPNWMTLISGATSGTPTGGDTPTEVSVTLRPTNNESLTVKTGSLDFSTTIGGAQLSASLRQDGFLTGSSSVSCDAYSTSPITKEVLARSTAPWSASADKDWITLDKSGGDGGVDENITVTVQNNTTTSQRQGTVTITCPSHPELTPRTYVITQKAFQWSVSPTSLSFQATAPGSKTISITSSAACEVTIPGGESWLTVSPSSHAAGTFTVTVTPQANTGAARSAKVRISTEGHSQEITVTQDAKPAQ